MRTAMDGAEGMGPEREPEQEPDVIRLTLPFHLRSGAVLRQVALLILHPVIVDRCGHADQQTRNEGMR